MERRLTSSISAEEAGEGPWGHQPQGQLLLLLLLDPPRAMCGTVGAWSLTMQGPGASGAGAGCEEALPSRVSF